MGALEAISEAIQAANGDAELDIDFKGSLTIAKSLFTIFGIYTATNVWRGSDSALAKPALRLLGFNVVLVVLITVYKLTRREIAPLFVMQLLSHYSTFLVFCALSGFGSHPRIKKGKRGDRRIGLAIWVLHLLFVAVLVVGFMLCECTEEAVYPISFVMSDALLFVTYVILQYVKNRRGFDITNLSKDGDDSAEDEEDLELFHAQLATFFKAFRVLVLWHTLEMVLGYFIFEYVLEEAVTCTEDGDKWEFRTPFGKMFQLLHTYGVKQGLGVASAVFYKSVKKLTKQRKKEAKKKAE